MDAVAFGHVEGGWDAVKVTQHAQARRHNTKPPSHPPPATFPLLSLRVCVCFVVDRTSWRKSTKKGGIRRSRTCSSPSSYEAAFAAGWPSLLPSFVPSARPLLEHRLVEEDTLGHDDGKKQICGLITNDVDFTLHTKTHTQEQEETPPPRHISTYCRAPVTGCPLLPLPLPLYIPF
jgi:hypothetical protein